MSTLSIKKSPNSKSRPRKARAGATAARAGRKGKLSSTIANVPQKADAPRVEARVTKQERVLTLLSRPEGASIGEMMQATDWQQHSVRGFLAGTVKKKLGFTLNSSKAEGDVRRYRIRTKRGR